MLLLKKRLFRLILLKEETVQDYCKEETVRTVIVIEETALSVTKEETALSKSVLEETALSVTGSSVSKKKTVGGCGKTPLPGAQVPWPWECQRFPPQNCK